MSDFETDLEALDKKAGAVAGLWMEIFNWPNWQFTDWSIDEYRNVEGEQNISLTFEEVPDPNSDDDDGWDSGCNTNYEDIPLAIFNSHIDAIGSYIRHLKRLKDEQERLNKASRDVENRISKETRYKHYLKLQAEFGERDYLETGE